MVVNQENATLRHARTQSLEATHEGLCKFSGSEDGQLKRVLGSFDWLFQKCREWRVMNKNTSNGRLAIGSRSRVLALDGG
jgi:hypothetical protein